MWKTWTVLIHLGLMDTGYCRTGSQFNDRTHRLTDVRARSEGEAEKKAFAQARSRGLQGLIEVLEKAQPARCSALSPPTPAITDRLCAFLTDGE